MRLRCLVGALLGLGMVGCSLVSSPDTASVPIDLPDKMFTVDTASWQLSDDGPADFLMMECGEQPSVCDSSAQLACGEGCTGTCDAATQTCDLSLEVSLYEAVDVAKEQPAVAQAGTTADVQVTIDAVTYEVTSNTLNLDTPALTVYVAPASVTGPGGMAKAIGTIAPVPAGHTAGAQQLVFTPTGQADLSAAMSSYETPFNIVIGSTLVLHAGDPAPTGKLDARLHIAAHGLL